jgi:hypothetical protein
MEHKKAVAAAKAAGQPPPNPPTVPGPLPGADPAAARPLPQEAPRIGLDKLAAAAFGPRPRKAAAANGPAAAVEAFEDEAGGAFRFRGPTRPTPLRRTSSALAVPPGAAKQKPQETHRRASAAAEATSPVQGFAPLDVAADRSRAAAAHGGGGGRGGADQRGRGGGSGRGGRGKVAEPSSSSSGGGARRRSTPSALTAEELAAAEEGATDLAGEMAKGAMTDAEMSTVRGWLAPPNTTLRSPPPCAFVFSSGEIMFFQLIGFWDLQLLALVSVGERRGR